MDNRDTSTTSALAHAIEADPRLATEALDILRDLYEESNLSWAQPSRSARWHQVMDRARELLRRTGAR